MSAKRILTVAVIFGGRSVEHDVSVVTGNQIMRAFPAERFEVVPVYITRDGRWLSGAPLLDLNSFKQDISALKGVESVVLSPSTQHHGFIMKPLAGRFQRSSVKRIDVLFPAIHGSHGEDGTLQGLFEMADIPYVGCGVLSSALANDKIVTKQAMRQAGIAVLDDVWFTRADWLADRDAVLRRIESTLTYPLFVKPATLGSSIGVTRVESAELLATAIDIATNFDRRVLVESALIGGDEINCSVMGLGGALEASVLEQPISWEKFLTYEEKYLRGNEGMKSAERIIPAPLTPQMTATIQSMARDAFRAIDGRGIARIDFLVKGEHAYLNEINTMPGSLALYLWRESGLTPAEVVEKLVRIAQDAHAEKRRTTFDYQTDLIAVTAQRGLKGAKGTKSSTGEKRVKA